MSIEKWCDYMIWFLTGTNRDCSSRREGKRTKNSGGSEKTRGGTSGFGAEEKIHNMASSNDVGRTQSHRWSSGILHPECSLHGHGSQKKKQQNRRLHDYN